MFGKKKEIEWPEMPRLCLTCGASGLFKSVKFEFRYTSAAGTLLTFLSPLAGSMYSRRMAYHPELPICRDCSAHLRRAKNVIILSVLLFVPALALPVLLIDYSPLFFLTPFVFLIAAYVYHGVVRRRGTPKTARVDKDHLILSVPGYGEFVLFEREPDAGRQTRRQAASAAPKLNRSVCNHCGFINFASAIECRKCNAQLGQTAAAIY